MATHGVVHKQYFHLAQYTVLIATVVAALGAVGVQTTSLVAILGTAGLAVGMALQGNLAHFASGVMILFFRPFTLGDIITAAGQTGQVKDIGLDFQVHCFSQADMNSHLGLLHNVRNAVYNELNAQGIEIPFNQIVVHQA